MLSGSAIRECAHRGAVRWGSGWYGAEAGGVPIGILILLVCTIRGWVGTWGVRDGGDECRVICGALGVSCGHSYQGSWVVSWVVSCGHSYQGSWVVVVVVPA